MDRAFERVLVIMFENQYRSYVLENSYMRRLAKRGIQLGNAFGVMHPSQTNYIASIAGELCNVTSDERPDLIDERTLVDLLEEAPGDLTWKAYMESYVAAASPWTPDFTPVDSNPYLVKHNPFSSFTNIVRNETRWSHIDDDAGFFADVMNGDLPNFAWFTPNMWSDGHWIDGTADEPTPRAPQLVDQLARWLERFFGRLRFPGPDSHLPPGTLVVVTFDEADFEADYLPDQVSAYDGANQIYTLLLGDDIEPGFEEEGYNHYSLLRTIEQNFGLDHLGKNDASSNWFQFLWGRRFGFGSPRAAVGVDTHRSGASTAIAAAGFGRALYVASAGRADSVEISIVPDANTSDWVHDATVDVDARNGVALAATHDRMVLAALGADGVVRTCTYDLQNGWSRGVVVGENVVGIAATSFHGAARVMLACVGADGLVTSRTWEAGEPHSWSDAVTVPTHADVAGISIGVLGASVLLVVTTTTGAMFTVSYNSQPFNVVTVAENQYGGAQDDTTIDQWSPSWTPVAHASSRLDQCTGRRTPDHVAFSTSGATAVTTLDGVMHLVHPAADDSQVLTETFSLSGLMTPAQPVSYKDYDSTTSSNGFGTGIEGGWSHQAPVLGTRCPPGGSVALATCSGEVHLLVRTPGTAEIHHRCGSYRTNDTEPGPIPSAETAMPSETTVPRRMPR